MDMKKNKKNEEQKEWIIPCNTDYFDIKSALKALKIIDWRQPFQMNNANVGDLVYLYCKPSGKTGSILYKGAVLEVNKVNNIIDDSKFSSDHQISTGPCISLAMFRVYELDDALTYAKLKEAGLNSRLQGPVMVKGQLADYLHSCDDKQRHVDRFMGSVPEECLVNFPFPINEVYTEKAPTTQTHHSNAEKQESTKGLLTEVKDGKRAVWLLAPGEKGCMMKRFVELGIAAIDWWGFDFGNLAEYDSKEDLVEYMQYCTGSENSFVNDSLCLFQFSHEIKPGDVIICKGGHTKLIGYGVVSKSYFHEDSDELGKYSSLYDCIIDTYKHRVGVQWISTDDREFRNRLPLKTLTKLKTDFAVELLTLYLDSLNSQAIAPLDDSYSDEEKTKHAESLDIDELKVIAEQQSTTTPKETTTTVVQRVRDPYIAEYARRRANGICQLCGVPAPFNRADGTPYLESHHIEWLSNGGADSVSNTVALCPNCHRKMHIVGDPEDIEWLKTVNKKLDQTK